MSLSKIIQLDGFVMTMYLLARGMTDGMMVDAVGFYTRLEQQSTPFCEIVMNDGSVFPFSKTAYIQQIFANGLSEIIFRGKAVERDLYQWHRYSRSNGGWILNEDKS